jgi:hypothetical protein
VINVGDTATILTSPLPSRAKLPAGWIPVLRNVSLLILIIVLGLTSVMGEESPSPALATMKRSALAGKSYSGPDSCRALNRTARLRLPTLCSSCRDR